MGWILTLVSLFLASVFNYLVYKNKKLSNLKAFIYKLFWVEEFSNAKNEHKFGFEFLNFGVKFFMYPYVLFISFHFINNVFTLNIEGVIYSIIMAIVYPLGYRLVMGFQRKLHGI